MKMRAIPDIQRAATSIKMTALLLMPLLMVIGLNISTGIIQDVPYFMTVNENYTFI